MRMKNKTGLEEMEIRLKQECVGILASNKPVETPEDAISLIQNELESLDREVFIVINLDAIKRPINYNVVSVGGTSIALLSPSNVFKSSILSNASLIMIVHNHPTGEIKPSKSDDDITATIGSAGEILNIKLLDSVIVGVGSNKYYSYKKEKPMFLRGINI